MTLELNLMLVKFENRVCKTKQLFPIYDSSIRHRFLVSFRGLSEDISIVSLYFSILKATKNHSGKLN